MIIPRQNSDEPPTATTVSGLVARMAAQAPAGASAPVAKKKEPKVKGPDSEKWLLSRDQKLVLVKLAQTAWVRSGAAKADESEEAFRQREALAACGRRISQATQKDYNALKSHFLQLAGDTAGAFDAQMKVSISDYNVALYKLRAELAKHKLTDSYAVAILSRKYKVSGLQWATAKQLWGVLFDVRRSHTRKAFDRRDMQAEIDAMRERHAAEDKQVQDYNEPF